MVFVVVVVSVLVLFGGASDAALDFGSEAFTPLFSPGPSLSSSRGCFLPPPGLQPSFGRQVLVGGSESTSDRDDEEDSGSVTGDDGGACNPSGTMDGLAVFFFSEYDFRGGAPIVLTGEVDRSSARFAV